MKTALGKIEAAARANRGGKTPKGKIRGQIRGAAAPGHRPGARFFPGSNRPPLLIMQQRHISRGIYPLGQKLNIPSKSPCFFEYKTKDCAFLAHHRINLKIFARKAAGKQVSSF